MSKLIFIRGIPGSGKTTLSKGLEKYFKFVYINPDCTKDPDIYNNNRNYRISIYRSNLECAKISLLKDLNVVWDQPWRKVGNVDKTIKLLNSDSNYIINIVSSPKVCWPNTKDKFKDYQEYLSFCEKFEILKANYNNIDIDYDHDINIKIKIVLDFLRV